MNYPQYILDVIFPIRCLGCGKLSSPKTGYICRKCLNAIPLKKKFECIGCKNQVSLGETCFRCRKNTSVDRLFTVYDYNDHLVTRMIKTLKYRFVSDIAKDMDFSVKKYIYWLAKDKKFNIIQDEPVIIPLPLHYRRFNWRGFNQAELIARNLAEATQRDIKTNIISRTSASKPQAEIEEREERLKNLRDNTFKIIDGSEIKDRAIILVDDVCTTGATLNEAARILKNEGAKYVTAFVIARG
jgi:competence protein ComFC